MKQLKGYVGMLGDSPKKRGHITTLVVVAVY